MPWGNMAQEAQGSTGTSASTFAVAFTTSNIVANNRIIVHVVAWDSLAPTITSVTDSAGNTYNGPLKRVTESDGTDMTVWDAVITVGAGTKPTVTAHNTGGTNVGLWAMFIREDSTLSTATSSYTDGVNGTAYAASASPILSGASTPVPGASNELAIGFYGDGGNTIATIGVSAGWTQRGTSIQNVGATCEGAISDQLSTSGTGSNASFTLSTTSTPGGAIVVVFKLAAAGATVPQIAHGYGPN